MVVGPDPPKADDAVAATTGSSVERDRIKLRHNEQTRLTATVLNNVATAFAVGGGIAPFITPLASAPTDAQVAWSIVWILIAVLVHLCARLVLRSLQP